MTKRLAILAVLFAVSGCGLDEYESLMAARLAELQERTRYASLYGPTPISREANGEEIAYPVTIRLPKAFGTTDWFQPGSRYRSQGDTIADLALYPPFLLEFPGLVRTGETFGDAAEKSSVGYYCYVGVLESRAVKFDAVLGDLRKKTAAKLPDTSAWHDVECRDESLAATTWKMFEAKGPQKFPRKDGLYPSVRDEAATFRVYAREEQGYIILWAVRVPDVLSGKVLLLDLADAVAGTVKVTGPAPTEPVETPKSKPPEKTNGETNETKPADATDAAPAGDAPTGNVPATDAAKADATGS